MRHYIHDNLHIKTKQELIQDMTFDDAHDYAKKIIFLYEFFKNRGTRDFLESGKFGSEFTYCCNQDLVYGEDENDRGTPFLDILSGINYFHDVDEYTTTTDWTGEDVKVNIANFDYSEEAVFQFSTTYNDNEMKHIIILGALRKHGCISFFMDLNYVEVLYDVLKGHRKEPILIMDDHEDYYSFQGVY